MRLKFPKNLISKTEYLMLSLEDKVRLLKFCYGYEDEEGVLPNDLLFDNMVAQLPDTSPLKYIDWDMITYDEVKDILDQVGIQVLTDDNKDVDYKTLFFREAICRILVTTLSLGISSVVSFIIMIIRDDKKSLADVFAKTKVIDIKEVL